MLLSLDTWSGVQVSFQETEGPSRQQVLEAVDQLDGKTHTEVSIQRDEPFEYLSISGGPNSYLVSGETCDDTFVQLSNPEAGEGKIELTCGGQSTEFRLRDVVHREKIPAAIDQFFAGLSDLPQPWIVE